MENKYILITGGELFNKGAQSMTFITINEVRKRFPNHEVLLISDLDSKRSEKDKEQYNFRICPDIFKFVYGSGIYSLVKRIDKKLVKESKEILSRTDMIIDISGYALASTWSLGSTIYFLSKINTAKKYKIRYFIMPQSFGPFNYNIIIRPVLNRFIKHTLSKADIICARENEGYNLLTEKFKLNNIRYSPDLVLSDIGLRKEDVYKNVSKDIKIKIESNGVGIIPNMKNFKHGSKEEIVLLYEMSIKELLKQGNYIYLIRHSFEDIEACELIKSKFENNNRVIVLGEDYSCFDYQDMVKKLKFLIASRYHSIVHAYKNSIPCIALGWATKYHELLGLFMQDQYVFDVREGMNQESFLDKIELMNKNWQNESDKIRENLIKIQSSNIFDMLEV